MEQPAPEMFTQRAAAEDSHSQLSGDGDSGRGGSVSDGHSNMGISHDAGTETFWLVDLFNNNRQH